MSGFFITGTDTDVGKTYVTELLMQRHIAAGETVAGFKPVAAGCEVTPEGLRNDDALLLQRAGSEMLAYEEINPYAFAPAIAPHIAAAEAAVAIDVSQLVTRCRALEARFDQVLVEGAGGWLVPLDLETSMADLAVALGLPVILVVGMRLGCLNHALLTARAISGAGLELHGWIANHAGFEMARRDINIGTLQALLPAPCLGVVPKGARELEPSPAV